MPEIFTLRIYKNRGGVGAGRTWLNEYAFAYPDGTKVEDLLPKEDAMKMYQFERQQSHDQVFFNRAVISTLIEGDGPPTVAQRTIGLEGRGTRAIPAGQAALPHEAVLTLTMGGLSGRSGRKEYRGHLIDFDVTGLSGTYQLKAGRVQQLSDDLNNYVIANQDTFARMRLITRSGNQVFQRGVADFTWEDITFQKGTANRRPKVSLDEDAIMARLRAMLKEYLFLNASLGAAIALNKVTKNAEINALLQQLAGVQDATPQV
jgi:hypothetical protein